MRRLDKVRIMTVVGARPNFMKAAPILAAIRAHNERLKFSPDDAPTERSQIGIDSILVHTGQHYDEAMSDQFFADLNIPKPDVHLGVGSGSHAAQTAEIVKRFEDVLLRERPHFLIVVGDVNSTLACALVASKTSYDAAGTRPLIAHVESGLRSFDRTMPEEINRILTDHLADLLFVTEESGLKNLREEGIPDHQAHLVGNTMIDSLLAFENKADESLILDRLGLHCEAAAGSLESRAAYAVLTLHRPSNVDRREGLVEILEGLSDLAHSFPVIFPAHPRTQKRIEEFGLERYFHLHRDHGREDPLPAVDGRIRMTGPLGYLDFLCLMKHAAIVVTDSGGIQEETTCLGVPCVTVRENTERPVTVTLGTNILAGTRAIGIGQATRQHLSLKKEGKTPDLWDGKSAQRILDVILQKIRDERLIEFEPAIS